MTRAGGQGGPRSTAPATWRGAPALPPPRPGTAGWLRALLRGAALGAVTFGCLGLLLALRLVERPLCGTARPVTPHITRFVCRTAFAILGIRRRVVGQPLRGGGAMVANHASWLDIFALNASALVYFVAKAEVARWPAIGWLARATGTLFIARDPGQAAAQTRLFEARLAAGHLLVFFPEGTSSDGLRVLPFKTTLFAAFLAPGLREGLRLQPVSLCYDAPAGEAPAFYGFWGDMPFAESLLRVLAAPRQGSVTVVFHPPLAVAGFADRKALAAAAEAAVRAGFAAAGGAGGQP
jgi:1-acyl-sn-glycerol-3-phosphate acyltransferase